MQGPLQTLFIEDLPSHTVLRLLDVLFLSCLHHDFVEPHALVLFTNQVILEEASTPNAETRTRWSKNGSNRLRPSSFASSRSRLAPSRTSTARYYYYSSSILVVT